MNLKLYMLERSSILYSHNSMFFLILILVSLLLRHQLFSLLSPYSFEKINDFFFFCYPWLEIIIFIVFVTPQIPGVS